MVLKYMQLCRFTCYKINVNSFLKGISRNLRSHFCSYSTQNLSRTGFVDYQLENERVQWNVAENFNFASHVLDEWAYKEIVHERKDHPPAFWYIYENGDELKWNFQDLAKKSKRTANILEYCGLVKGDNLMLILPKVPEFWLINVAAIRTGTILCPASVLLTARDIKYRFETFQPKCIIADEHVADAVDEVSHYCPSLETKILVSNSKNERKGWLNFDTLYNNVSSQHQCIENSKDDSMMVFFTSGTTGLAKMVEHSHASYGFALGLTGRYWMDLTSNNVMWNLSDTGWAKTAYGNLFGPWSQGACAFIHQMPRFASSLVIKILSEYPVDTLCAPPTAYRFLVQENLSAIRSSSLSHCISAGEPLNPEIIRLWDEATNLRIYEGYGQTETVVLLGMYKCLRYIPGSIGKPLPGTDIAIVNKDLVELGPYEEGGIALKKKPRVPVGLFNGYKNDPIGTANRSTEYFYCTGDTGYYDDEGYFYFVGRDDDIINASGYRIGPFEVESALIEHPLVVEAAVVSSPDQQRGEVVKAFVVLNQDFSDDKLHNLKTELQEHVKKVTAPYKYPRKIEFVKELPKTVSGKIMRNALKKKEWSKVQNLKK